MDAVAVPGRLVALELEPDEHPLRMRAPLEERVAADEVVLLVGRDREADPGLEGVDLVVELVAGEDQARLDPQHVERVEAERRDPVRRTRLHHGVVERGRVLRMAEELVAELARVAGAGGDQRQALRPAEAADREAEPLQLGERRLRRRRPHDPRQDLARGGALDADVVEVVGRLLHPDAQSEPVGLLAQPDAVVLGAADEAEVVRRDPEHGAVVEHAARLVAHRRVDDLAVGEPADVTGHRRLHQRLGVRAEDLELPQRREVHHGRLLAAGPVLGDGAEVVVRGREPVAVVLGEPARQRRGLLVEAGLLASASAPHQA